MESQIRDLKRLVVTASQSSAKSDAELAKALAEVQHHDMMEDEKVIFQPVEDKSVSLDSNQIFTALGILVCAAIIFGNIIGRVSWFRFYRGVLLVFSFCSQNQTTLLAKYNIRSSNVAYGSFCAHCSNMNMFKFTPPNNHIECGLSLCWLVLAIEPIWKFIRSSYQPLNKIDHN